MRRDEIIDFIKKSFANRSKPSQVIFLSHSSTHEYIEAAQFEKLIWEEVDSDLMEKASDAIYGLSAEAFVYFLPGFLSTGLRHDRVDYLIYDALISMLDRGMGETGWNDFFRQRWLLLNQQELLAFSEWLLWLSDKSSDYFFEGNLDRSFDTVNLLLRRLGN
ncbi:hypothetical protein HG421_13605 [Xanthomonas campestris pv. badrii]|uniref:Uncharacterized protein n=1 Tax=Xanthomonas campestris pv. badrii TaxID=149696 RepID=A0A7Z2VC40_XANCA|nr:DUF6714 family protein [Xanthomonas campestris]QJD68632.1 hypothetical protein HG421_13605 [Xanthomonas campestris pv. badrii]